MAIDAVGILGAGAWGSALANVAARGGRRTLLWGRNPDALRVIADERRYPAVPGAPVADGVDTTTDLSDLAETDAVLVAVPAQEFRIALKNLAACVSRPLPIVACAKGIERGTRAFMTDIIAETLPGCPPAILSGPSFAGEVARAQPTAIVLAAHDEAVAVALAEALRSATFRPYHSTDVRGVEIGGAAKNVLAIACGAVAGYGLGQSAAAALTTRGFAELVRFGRAYDARSETLTGLSGLGDVVLSCTGAQSRNFAYGLRLGRGQKADAIGDLAEGAFTAAVLVELARSRGVEMPIAEAVAHLVEARLDVAGAIAAMMARPLRAETE